MRKILLGISVLISLAFLASCGGGSSGSKGAAGTAGADGAAGTAGTNGTNGTDGTILVPTDADLAITASTTADTDESLGQVARSFTLSGTDNATLDSRMRYYGYLGTSSTAKSYLADTADTNEVTVSLADAWPIDTRHKTVDNITLTLDANDDLGAGDGLVSHLIVCAGNEAGDMASCPSAAIEDIGVTYANAGGTSGVTSADNSTSGMVVPTGTGDDFQMFHSNSTGSGVIASAVTDVKGSAPTIGGASAVHQASATEMVTAMAAMGTSDAVYLLVQDNTTTDNGTFWSRTATSGNLASATGVINDVYPIHKGAMLIPVSSTKAYAVWARSSTNADTDNDTRVYASLLTLSAGTVTASNIGDYVAAKAADNNTQLANASLAYGTDNGDALPSDFPICAAGRAESMTAGGYAGGNTTTHLAIGYNEGGPVGSPGLASYKVAFTSDSDNFSYRTVADVGSMSSTGGGATQVQGCAMTWADGLIGAAAATDNGTLWWAGIDSTDNDSTRVILKNTTLADNGSAAVAFTANGIAVDYVTAVHQVALSYDHLNRPYLAALLDNGSVRLHWSAAGSIPVVYNGGIVSNVGDSSKPISLTRSADGKQLALGYHDTAGTDMKVVVIYADGSSN